MKATSFSSSISANLGNSGENHYMELTRRGQRSTHRARGEGLFVGGLIGGRDTVRPIEMVGGAFVPPVPTGTHCTHTHTHMVM